MWYDSLKTGHWTELWFQYIRCTCHGIRVATEPCPACGDEAPSSEPQGTRMNDGTEISLGATFMGAEGRYEDYVYLSMLEREWHRPTGPSDGLTGLSMDNRPSTRAAVVIVFWTYFETRIERLFTTAMRNLPGPVRSEMLERNASIGARLDRLYRTLFGTTYYADLEELGFRDVATLLQDLQSSRNQFVHGDPGAVDDSLVLRLVEQIQREHEGWIAVFNDRIHSLIPPDPARHQREDSMSSARRPGSAKELLDP